MEERARGAIQGMMFGRILRFSAVAGVAAWAALAFWPYHDGVLRYGLPLSTATLWLAALALGWKSKVRWLLLALPLIAAIPFCLPAKSYDRDELRFEYVKSMREMEGIRYLWGGESRQGIDCSGLPRKALREALLKEGLRHRNGWAFREWVRQWWYDSSAKALGAGYRGFTRPLGITGVLRGLTSESLWAGDLAVTKDGRHVMIYVGNDQWIQADPGASKVTIGTPASDPNPWFEADVTVHRWCLLDD